MKQKTVLTKKAIHAIVTAGLFSLFGLGMLIVSSGFKDSSVATQTFTSGSLSTGTAQTPKSEPVFQLGDGKFSYAPAVIKDGSTDYIWSCTNKTENTSATSILFTKKVNDTIVTNSIVLEPSAGKWDGANICDPEVVSGKFQYKNTSYAYALFYSGNNSTQNLKNQVGVAFSQEIAGPWIKAESPIIKNSTNSTTGITKPSAVKIGDDLILFYTQDSGSDVAEYWTKLDLTTVSQPRMSEPIKVISNGMTSLTGEQSTANKLKFAFDSGSSTFYAVKGAEPYEETYPNGISTSLQVFGIKKDDLLNSTGTWLSVKTIAPFDTGYSRNHNASFERDALGQMSYRSSSVYFSVSCALATDKKCTDAQSTFRILKTRLVEPSLRITN